jgi:hypothetical protein
MVFSPLGAPFRKVGLSDAFPTFNQAPLVFRPLNSSPLISSEPSGTFGAMATDPFLPAPRSEWNSTRIPWADVPLSAPLPVVDFPGQVSPRLPAADVPLSAMHTTDDFPDQISPRLPATDVPLSEPLASHDPPDQVPPRLPDVRCPDRVLPQRRQQLFPPDEDPAYNSQSTRSHIATLCSTPRRLALPVEFLEPCGDYDDESEPEGVAVSQPQYFQENPNFNAVVHAAIQEALKDETLGRTVLGHFLPNIHARVSHAAPPLHYSQLHDSAYAATTNDREGKRCWAFAVAGVTEPIADVHSVCGPT